MKKKKKPAPDSQIVYPFIEVDKIEGFPSIRVHFSATDQTLWMVSKRELFYSLQMRSDAKKMTRYEVFEITKEMKDKDIPLIFHEEDVQMPEFVKEMLTEIERELLKENPFSSIPRIRTTELNGKTVWYFSGPNYTSDPFNNLSAADTVLEDMIDSKEIDSNEKIRLAQLLNTIDIPAKSTRLNYDA